jgi:hypothetical protein
MNNVKVRDDLSYQSENGYESTFIEISQTRRKNIICGCIYKHPNLPPDQFFEECLLKILDKITKEDKLITLMGDFNLNLLNYDTAKCSSDFYDIVTSHNLQPLILQPSRVTLRSQMLIDNILTNNVKYDSVSGNLTCSISDHFAQFTIFTNYNSGPESTKKMCIYGRSYSTFNQNEFLEELTNIDWNLLFDGEENPEVLLRIFIDKLTDILNLMAPYRKLTRKEVSSQQKPWITFNVLKSIKVRDKFLKLFMK